MVNIDVSAGTWEVMWASHYLRRCAIEKDDSPPDYPIFYTNVFYGLDYDAMKDWKKHHYARYRDVKFVWDSTYDATLGKTVFTLTVHTRYPQIDVPILKGLSRSPFEGYLGVRTI